MNIIYIEFLKELKNQLENIEKSSWHTSIQKSIDKYELNQDVEHFLGSFGGTGSINDEPLSNETTQVLMNLTYILAKRIQNEETFDLKNILKKEYIKKEQYLDYLKQEIDYWNKEKDIESRTNELKFINYIIENYEIGNLSEIITKYLEQKSININEKKY